MNNATDSGWLGHGIEHARMVRVLKLDNGGSDYKKLADLVSSQDPRLSGVSSGASDRGAFDSQGTRTRLYKKRKQLVSNVQSMTGEERLTTKRGQQAGRVPEGQPLSGPGISVSESERRGHSRGKNSREIHPAPTNSWGVLG